MDRYCCFNFQATGTSPNFAASFSLTANSIVQAGGDAKAQLVFPNYYNLGPQIPTQSVAGNVACSIVTKWPSLVVQCQSGNSNIMAANFAITANDAFVGPFYVNLLGPDGNWNTCEFSMSCPAPPPLSSTVPSYSNTTIKSQSSNTYVPSNTPPPVAMGESNGATPTQTPNSLQINSWGIPVGAAVVGLVLISFFVYAQRLKSKRDEARISTVKRPSLLVETGDIVNQNSVLNSQGTSDNLASYNPPGIFSTKAHKSPRMSREIPFTSPLTSTPLSPKTMNSGKAIRRSGALKLRSTSPKSPSSPKSRKSPTSAASTSSDIPVMLSVAPSLNVSMMPSKRTTLRPNPSPSEDGFPERRFSPRVSRPTTSPS